MRADPAPNSRAENFLISRDFAVSRYTARVELSSKVVDCVDRLRRTLAHELCHVAAWLVDHVSKPPHGQVVTAYKMAQSHVILLA